MVWVFPGWEEVLASDFRFISALIKDDFPTLDFPANAISGLSFAGITLVIPQTVSKLALFIIIVFSISRSFLRIQEESKPPIFNFLQWQALIFYP